jgi:hypothetical protein
MLDKFPDGFDNRFPGKKGKRVTRVPLHALGPYYEMSSDGHEKIAPSALRMGGVGFSIYGFKDKFADYLLFLKIYPDVRSRGAGGHIFLDFVQETGCRAPSLELCISMTFLLDIPIQLTTDKGSEVGWLYAFMSTLRYVFLLYLTIHSFTTLQRDLCG